MCKCMQADLCDKIRLKNGNSPQKISMKSRSSPPDVFLGKGVLKINKKLTGEHENTPAEVPFH